jgi:hypothetical protein
MKLFKTLSITVVFFCLAATAVATELNGRISILNNNGTNYKIMLEVNTDLEPGELGGATIILNYDNTVLSYPDEPEQGTDFTFYNFNLGYYDEARVTKVTDNQIWININLISDEYGTIVPNGPYQWTDLVLLNFGSNAIVTSNAVFWDINNSYWKVYNSDNTTIWGIGNFDNLTTSIENENVENPVNSYILNQNYPNPFNPSTTIQFSLPKTTQLKINVYNMLGELVETIAEGTYEAGFHKVTFSAIGGSASGGNASALPSGTYIYRIESSDFVQVRKMVLIK